MFTPVWNVILSILRSLMDSYTMEMILGSQNWQDYISNGCVHPLFKWDLCNDGGKNRLTSISTLIFDCENSNCVLFCPKKIVFFWSIVFCIRGRVDLLQKYIFAFYGIYLSVFISVRIAIRNNKYWCSSVLEFRSKMYKHLSWMKEVLLSRMLTINYSGKIDYFSKNTQKS